ncbi:MAG: hypothetical protein WC505_07615 [Patescibacteria group bacterium]
MRVRTGFVSNSSSSSFVLNTCALTVQQYRQIKHLAEAENWNISETETELRLWTIMDNCEMAKFIRDIGADGAVTERDTE